MEMCKWNELFTCPFSSLLPQMVRVPCTMKGQHWCCFRRSRAMCLGHCPRKLSMFWLQWRLVSPQNNIDGIDDINYGCIHKFWLHIWHTFHNHALSVGYRHPWFQKSKRFTNHSEQLPAVLPGFGATIMGSMLVQRSAGCQTLRFHGRDTGITGEKPQVTVGHEFSGWGLRYNLLSLCKCLKFQKLNLLSNRRVEYMVVP